MQEIRVAIRSLSKTFGFSITAILMLAFGIGATTAIFSVVEGVLLRHLPFPDPERLVMVGDKLEGAAWDQPAVTAPEIASYMRDSHSFVSLGAPDGRTAEQIYQPVLQWKASRPFAAATELNGNSGYIVLRTALPPEQLENALRATVRGLDPELALDQIQTMDHAIAASEAPRRFHTVLVSSFAIAAVLLSVLGIYSVIAFSIALRRQEMAIRMALGSQRSGILGLVFASGAKLSAFGCVLGTVGIVMISRILRSFLFGVSPFDPMVLVSSVLAMLFLTLAACTLPAIRAAKTDPALVLRGE